MNIEALKKALIRGIPIGLGIALVYIMIRMLLSGGNLFDQMSTVYGILTLICVPIACVVFCCEMEKKNQEKK